MKIRIWGCRGSITVPGPTTLRYGGNSTCLEIRTATGQIIVVDAGSGLRNLGKDLSQGKEVIQVRFFLTHSHWDHLVGFPFFEPAYSSHSSITFCGGPHTQDSIRRYLAHQMEAPYFPVDFNLLKLYYDLAIGSLSAGSDAWAYHDVIADRADVGAPQDDFSPDGQKWGFPPLIPEKLKENAYELFIQTIRSEA